MKEFAVLLIALPAAMYLVAMTVYLLVLMLTGVASMVSELAGIITAFLTGGRA